MPENFDGARANRDRQQVFCGKEEDIDTVEVCGSSPHGPTILFSDLASKPSFDKAPNGSIKDAANRNLQCAYWRSTLVKPLPNFKSK
jgi:hypothetical protein